MSQEEREPLIAAAAARATSFAGSITALNIGALMSAIPLQTDVPRFKDFIGAISPDVNSSTSVNGHARAIYDYGETCQLTPTALIWVGEITGGVCESPQFLPVSGYLQSELREL
jgi:hypothetical protein